MKRLRTVALTGALAAALACAGCGFQPLYGDGAGSTAAANLPAIYVDIIPNRNGQQLRQALQARLEGPDAGQTKRYELLVAYSIQQQGLAVQPDNSTTRTRFIGRAAWYLKTVDGAVIATGNVRTLDGVDNLDEQPFESLLAGEKTQGRIADNLADEMTAQIQTYFLHRGERPAGA